MDKKYFINTLYKMFREESQYVIFKWFQSIVKEYYHNSCKLPNIDSKHEKKAVK